MRRLSEGKIRENILYMTIPILLTHILQNVYNLTDMFFVGRLGSVSIASVSVSGVIIGIIITFAVGLSVGTMSMVSRNVGTGRNKEAKKSIAQSLNISIIVYIVIFIFSCLFLDSVFKFMGARERERI